MYIMYNAYMIKHYTVATFRKQLREALNQADEGDTVIIDRYGSSYELVSLDSDKAQKKVNVQTPPAYKVVQSVQIAKKPISIDNPTSRPTPDVAGTIPVKKAPEFKFPPSAASQIIKTPAEAKKIVETPQFIDKKYSARKPGSKERHVDL